MQSIQFKGRIGKDGILRVQMPAEFKDRDLEAIVIFQAKSENLKHENWQPGFFEEVIGGTEFSRVPNLQIEDWEL